MACVRTETPNIPLDRYWGLNRDGPLLDFVQYFDLARDGPLAIYRIRRLASEALGILLERPDRAAQVVEALGDHIINPHQHGSDYLKMARAVFMSDRLIVDTANSKSPEDSPGLKVGRLIIKGTVGKENYFTGRLMTKEFGEVYLARMIMLPHHPEKKDPDYIPEWDPETIEQIPRAS